MLLWVFEIEIGILVKTQRGIDQFRCIQLGMAVRVRMNVCQKQQHEQVKEAGDGRLEDGQ